MEHLHLDDVSISYVTTIKELTTVPNTVPFSPNELRPIKWTQQPYPDLYETNRTETTSGGSLGTVC